MRYNRCAHCAYRNSWDCEDYKIPDEYSCDRFRLDYDTLTPKQKKTVQHYFMYNTDGCFEE